MQNKWTTDYAHLPRVQVPVHINMLDMEFLEYTTKGDPRTWLKYTKYTELLLNWTEQALNGVILHVCEQLWKHMVTKFDKKWKFLHRNAARLLLYTIKLL